MAKRKKIMINFRAINHVAKDNCAQSLTMSTSFKNIQLRA